jgi:hypothetical protein
VLGPDGHPALAGVHEHVLHGVRHLDGRLEADDPGGALERVRRPHHRFERLGRPFELLDREHRRREHGRLRVGLEPEQVQHRESAEVFHSAFPRRRP